MILTLPHQTETDVAAVAEDLARLAPGRVTYALTGDLGTGKTTFVRAFIRALSGQADLAVTSPTFNLVTSYDTPRGGVRHADLYRVKQAAEIDELDLYPASDVWAVLVEWADRGGPWPARTIRIDLTADGDGTRRVVIDFGSVVTFPDTAFIFAAGLGTRMAALTATTPKPLVPVAGRPIMAYLFDQLRQAGVRRVIINTHYLPDQIAAFVEKYRADFDIQLRHEAVLLETGGGTVAALPMVDRDVFYALNGDALQVEGPGLPHLVRLGMMFDPAQMDLLLMVADLTKPRITDGAGDYFLEVDGRLREAPQKSGTHFFAGPRVVHRRLLAGPMPEKFSFKVLFDTAEAQGRLFGLVHRGDYHHISTPDDVARVGAALTQEAKR